MRFCRCLKSVSEMKRLGQRLGWALAAVLLAACSESGDPLEEAATATLRIRLAFPEPIEQEWSGAATRADDPPPVLRCVAEVYEAGTGQCLMHRVLSPEATDNPEVMLATLDGLPPEACDILLWADYVAGDDEAIGYYDTESLRAITRNEEMAYTTDPEWRRAYYALISPDMAQGSVLTREVEMQHPFARYRIVATDLVHYEEIKRVNQYPDVEGIVAQVVCSSYFPTSFNAWTGLPNDAQMGVAFESDALRSDEGVVLVDDLLWANTNRSSVILSITLLDRSTRRVISRVDDLVVNYQRDYRTTLSGAFLTAGTASGGVTVDEEWEGEFNVEF